MSKTHFFFILGGFKTFYFSIVKSWRGGQVKFLASGRGGPGFIFDAEKYKPPAPQPVNSEPSLIYMRIKKGEKTH